MSLSSQRYPEGPIPISSAFRCLEQLPPNGEVTLTLELRSIYALLMLLERIEFERRWNRGECRAFQKLSGAVNAAYALHQATLIEEAALEEVQKAV